MVPAGGGVSLRGAVWPSERSRLRLLIGGHGPQRLDGARTVPTDVGPRDPRQLQLRYERSHSLAKVCRRLTSVAVALEAVQRLLADPHRRMWYATTADWSSRASEASRLPARPTASEGRPVRRSLEQGHVVEVQRTPRDREIPHQNNQSFLSRFDYGDATFLSGTVDEKCDLRPQVDEKMRFA